MSLNDIDRGDEDKRLRAALIVLTFLKKEDRDRVVKAFDTETSDAVDRALRHWDREAANKTKALAMVGNGNALLGGIFSGSLGSMASSTIPDALRNLVARGIVMTLSSMDLMPNNEANVSAVDAALKTIGKFAGWGSFTESLSNGTDIQKAVEAANRDEVLYAGGSKLLPP